MSAKLYHAANELLAVLGANGEIKMDHEAATALLWAVDDIDGGIYNKDFGKRKRKQKPDTLPLDEPTQEAIVEAANVCVVAGNGCKDEGRRNHLHKTAETIRHLVRHP